MVLEIGVGLVLVSLFVGAFTWWTRRRSDRLDMAAHFRTECIDAAQTLIRDERIPDEIAQFAKFLADSLLSPWPLRAIIIHLLFNGRKVKRPGLLALVDKLPADLQGQFAKLVVTFGVAITYNNLLLGYFMRRLFWVVANGAPKTTVQDNRVRALTNDLAEKACAA